MGQEIIRPRIGKGTFIAPTAYVGGDVTIGDDCTIMHQVTIRGDVSAIRIGSRVNVQDGTVIHTKTGVDLELGDEIGIGHLAVVHCRRVGSRTLIGIGAIVLDDCEIGEGCFIGAGSLLTPGMIIPPGKLVLGSPAKIIRDCTETDRKYVGFVVDNYLRLNRLHAAGVYPNAAPAI